MFFLNPEKKGKSEEKKILKNQPKITKKNGDQEKVAIKFSFYNFLISFLQKSSLKVSEVSGFETSFHILLELRAPRQEYSTLESWDNYRNKN